MNTGEGDQRRLGLSASPELALWGSRKLEGTVAVLEKRINSIQPWDSNSQYQEDVSSPREKQARLPGRGSIGKVPRTLAAGVREHLPQAKDRCT